MAPRWFWLALVPSARCFTPGPAVLRNYAKRPSLSPVLHGPSSLNALVPLLAEEAEELLVTRVPSGPQYASYWGRTKRERYNTILESSIVTFLGVFFSYFLSFVLGGFVATIFGALFLFWGILSPDLKSRQRNWEFLGGRQLVDAYAADDVDFVDDDSWRQEDKQGLYASLFIGRVQDVCVVESTSAVEEFDIADFSEYTMDTDELEKWEGTPYLIRILLADDERRELQIHARMSEEYIYIRQNMPAVAILLSTSQKFTKLAALTDVMILDAECWVGDYPYLNREEVERFLAEDVDLWDTLQAQRTPLVDEFEDFDYDRVKNNWSLPPPMERRQPDPPQQEY